MSRWEWTVARAIFPVLCVLTAAQLVVTGHL